MQVAVLFCKFRHFTAHYDNQQYYDQTTQQLLVNDFAILSTYNFKRFNLRHLTVTVSKNTICLASEV